MLSLTACWGPNRSAQREEGIHNEIIKYVLWTDHYFYEFGEPVQVRFKLTNISNETLILQSPLGTEPVVDVIIQTGPYLSPTEKHTWSQSHPEDVVSTLVLEPGESYVIEWSQVLSQDQTDYGVEARWFDNYSADRMISLPISHHNPIKGMP
jgi:hypothetical protein